MKIGDAAPELDVTEHVGTFAPHCVLLFAVGIEGSAVAVTVTLAETRQLFIVALPVNVVFVETAAVNGFVVPTTAVPSDQEYPVMAGTLLPANVIFGLLVEVVGVGDDVQKLVFELAAYAYKTELYDVAV